MDLIRDCPLLDLIRLKVLLVPISPFPSLERYVSLLQANAKISIAELALNLSTESKLSAAQNPLLSVLHSALPDFRALNFVNDKNFIAFDFLKYHPELEALDQWMDLQPHRQLFGIIGLVHCPSTQGSLTDAYLCFSRSIEQLPKVHFTRVFAFEPDESQPDSEGNVILIPNQKDEQILFYLNTLMQDIAASCIRTMRLLIEEIEKNTDPDASPVLGLLSSGLAKRRTYSRNHKRLGDRFLLCGFTKAAISNYLLAFEGIKAHEDPLWQAALQEALLTANLVKSMESESAGHNTEQMCGLGDKLREVSAIYEKAGAYVPWLDTTIKLAYIAMLAKEGGAAEAWKCYMKSLDVLHLISSRTELTYVASVLAQKTRELGFRRSSLLFHAKAADALLAEPSTESRQMALRSYETVLAAVDTKWQRIYQATLWQIIGLARAQEPERPVRHILHYFCAFDASFHDAEPLLHELQALCNSLTRPIHVRGFDYLHIGLPIFESIIFSVQEPVGLDPGSGSLYSLFRPERDLSDPFIYAPFQQPAADNSANQRLVGRNEPVLFTVTLKNPFRVPIRIHELAPILKPAMALKFETRDFTVPAASPSVPIARHSVTLRGLPDAGGRVRITGCSLKTHGTLFDYLVSDSGAVYTREPSGARGPCAENESCSMLEKEPWAVATGLPLAVSLVKPQRKSELTPLRVLEGQRVDITLKLQNTSAATPIDSLRISAALLNEHRQELLVDPFYSLSLTCSETLVDSALPLRASTSFLLPLSLLIFQKCSYIQLHFRRRQEPNEQGASLALPIVFLTCIEVSSIYFYEAFEQTWASESAALISLQATPSDNDFLAALTLESQHLSEDCAVDFANGDSPLVLKPGATKRQVARFPVSPPPHCVMRPARVYLRMRKFPLSGKTQDQSLLVHTARLFNDHLACHWQSAKSLIPGRLVFKPMLFQTAELETAYEAPFTLSIEADVVLVQLGQRTTKTISVAHHRDCADTSLSLCIVPLSDGDSFFLESPSEYHAAWAPPSEKTEFAFSAVFYALGSYEFQILAHAAKEHAFQISRRVLFKVYQ